MVWQVSYYQTPHDNRAQPYTYPALSQVVKLTPFLSGSHLQVLVNNFFGPSTLTFYQALIATNPDFAGARPLTLNGQATITIPRGKAVGLVPLPFPVTAGQPLYFCLRADRAQTYADLASTYDPSLVNAALSPRASASPRLSEKWRQRKSWFCLAGFRVFREEQAPLVELGGDSLIETGMVAAAIGRFLLANFFDQAALINTAVSGSQLLRDAPAEPPLLASFGPSILHRLAQSPWRPAVQLVSAGGNDLMMPALAHQEPASLAELQAGFDQLAATVASRGGQLLVPGMGPARRPGAAYGGGDPAVNQRRAALNQWLQAQPWGINLVPALADADGYLAPEYDFGDHLHLSPAGGARYAAAVTPRLASLLAAAKGGA